MFLAKRTRIPEGARKAYSILHLQTIEFYDAINTIFFNFFTFYHFVEKWNIIDINTVFDHVMKYARIFWQIYLKWLKIIVYKVRFSFVLNIPN